MEDHEIAHEHAVEEPDNSGGDDQNERLHDEDLGDEPLREPEGPHHRDLARLVVNIGGHAGTETEKAEAHADDHDDVEYLIHRRGLVLELLLAVSDPRVGAKEIHICGILLWS